MGLFDWLNNGNNNALREWMRQRCKIQCGPGKSDEDAISLLEEFSKYYDERFGDIADEKQIDIQFQTFLTDNMPEEDLWGQRENDAKECVGMINTYRRDGTLDSNLVDEIMKHARFINNDPLRYVYELSQNADDCDYENGVVPKIDIRIETAKMTVSYPEKGMTWSDILAITTIGQSNKVAKKREKRIIGEKGRGFKTIFSVCEEVEIYSGHYRFKLKSDSFRPMWIEKGTEEQGTKMILHFRKSIKSGDKENKEEKNKFSEEGVFEELISKYGVMNGQISEEDMLSFCPVLFTNRICSINISKVDDGGVSDELRISRELNDDGTITLKYQWNKCKPEKLDCLRIEKTTRFTYEEYISRYPNVFADESEFISAKEDVKSYPSVFIVPKNTAIISCGKLYSYLPTDIQIKAPVAIQIPFELNEDRSCMFIKGMKGNEHPDVNDGETTKWNKRLFDDAFRYDAENPCLLQLAYEEIRTRAKEQGDIDMQEIVLGYIPTYKDNNHQFFFSKTSEKECNALNEYCKVEDSNVIFETYRSIPLVRGLLNEDKWLSAAEDPIMFDEMVDDIILTMNNDSISSLLCCVFDGQGDKASVERIVRFYKKEELQTLGIKPLGDDNKRTKGIKPDYLGDDNEKTNLLNCLLDIGGDAAYEQIVDSYVSENKSAYFPYDMSGVKIIKMPNGERWCEKDAHIWIVADDNDVTKNYESYESNEDIAVFDIDRNTIDIDGEKKNYKISQGLDEGKTPIEMLKCILERNPYKDPDPIYSYDGTRETKVKPYSYRQVIHFLNLCVCLLPLDNDKSKHFSNIIDFCEASKTNNPDEVPDKVIQLIQDKVWKRRVGSYWRYNNHNYKKDERRYSYLAYREELAKELKEAPDNEEVEKIFQDFELLGIFLHLKSKCQEEYELPPITNWTMSIIEAINKAPVSGKNKPLFCFNQNEQVKKCENPLITKEFDCLKKMGAAGLPENADIYFYPFEAGTESVRFACIENNKEKLAVIIKENKFANNDGLIEFVKDFVKTLSEDVPILLRAEEIRKEIRDKECDLYRKPISALGEADRQKAIKESLKEDLTQLCAIDAYASNDARPESGSNHEIWNELLQNANDHIPADAPADERILRIFVRGNELELKYPDKGFSVRDFFAVCTSGNSGNKESGENREGNKGTGFKSIYNLFRKVTIKSYGVQCVLEDVKRDLSIGKNLDVRIGEAHGDTAPKNYYPIPEFDPITDGIFEGTIVSLELKAGKTVEDIKKMLFGDSLEQRFIHQKTFLFLDHIACFEFNENGAGFFFDRENYISENYFDYTEELDLDVNKICRDNSIPPRWKDRSWPAEKQKVRFLFPKEYLDSDSIKDEEKPVYCTLPISNYKLAIPFYVNIPLLELNDERKNLHDGLKDWNKCILKAAFGALKKVFEENNLEPESGKAPDGLNLTNLYRFFPYKYSGNGNSIYQDLYVWDILADVKFLRTTKGDGNEPRVQARSIADDQWLFLPDYMYWWFGKKDGLDKFTCKNEFLFYEGIRPLDESGTLSGKGGHSIVKEKLFNNRAFRPIDEIVSYVNEIAHNISLNKSVTAEDAVAIQNIQENDFCIFLKEIFKNNANNISVKQQVIGSFLEFYLGSHLQNGKYHCLGLNSNSNVLTESIGEYISIASVLETMCKFFEDSNLRQLDYKRLGFSNLIDSVYYDQKPEQEPSERSERIDTDRETLKIICEALMREKDSDGWRLIAEETKTYLKCDNEAIRLKLLIENKILDMDFVTDIVASVDWAETSCYRMMVRSLLNEEFSDEKTKEYKIPELFKLFVKLDRKNNICDTWEPSYKRYISDCKQEDLEGVRFSITNNNQDNNQEIQPIDKALKDRFNEKVCDDTKAELKDVWGRKNNGPRIELKNIVEDHIYIVKDCHTAGRNLYCFAQKGDKEAVLLFTENAFGSVLRDLYECTEYSETTPYISMDCFRTNILRPWMDYSDLEESELTTIKNSVIKIWRELKDDRDSLICKLVSPYTIRTGKQLIKARGYGGEKWEEKRCPVCDACLLAESSVLKIRNVSYSKDGRLKHLPLLLCNNCSDSFRYANDVQWNPKDPEQELQLDKINNNDMLKLKITFEFPAETKILEVRMTYLLRVIWCAIIEGVEEQKQK